MLASNIIIRLSWKNRSVRGQHSKAGQRTHGDACSAMPQNFEKQKAINSGKVSLFFQ